MKKLLTKIENKLYHYIYGEKISGKNADMSGNCTGLSGDCTGLIGNCTDLRGHLDECEISDAERSKCIFIGDLIKEQP